jgi:serine/threonine-protein kinase
VASAEQTGEGWKRFQGQVINGSLPLVQVIGSSDHSGVFLTHSAELGSTELAVKLIAANRGLAESLLPRWKRTGRIAHPNLIRLLQWGGCQLDGMPFLYVVMEHADQTLAQVLQQRALDEDEAKKVLEPTLAALAFLHHQNLVHGGLKPSNVLVVGDVLKLAGDSIRRVGDVSASGSTVAMDGTPRERGPDESAAEDIRALGACLYQALTRRPPLSPDGTKPVVDLSSDFSPAYRDIVTRCLSPAADSRPTATELLAWVLGGPAGPGRPPDLEPSPSESAEPPTLEISTGAAPGADAAPGPTPPVPLSARMRGRRTSIAAVLGGVAFVALVWTGLRAIQSHRAAAPPVALDNPSTERPGAPAIGPAAPTPASSGRGVSQPSMGLRHVTPDVPVSALRTVKGHVKVWVRVVVERDGSVFAATAERAGPSRYFERLAIEAAKQWTFPPVEADARRLVQIRFDFSRDGTTAHAVELH